MAGKELPERVSDQRKLVVERIVHDMAEKGMSWPTNQWTKLISPKNAVTGAQYKGVNRLHLAAVAAIRGFEDRRWVTFNQAKKAGWKVKKGAKSSIVEKWKLYRYGGGDSDGGDNEEPGVVIPRCVGWFNVFNVEEIDGVPADEAAVLRGDVSDDAGLTADRFIASSRCPVNETASDQAYYSPSKDLVTVPKRVQFPSNEGFLRVLLHEMTHSTMKPLERPHGARFGTPEYAFEELVAELGSMFAATDAGFDCTALVAADAGELFYGAHVGYLKSWIQVLEDDPDELFKAAAKASAASDYLIERLDGAVAEKPAA